MDAYTQCTLLLLLHVYVVCSTSPTSLPAEDRGWASARDAYVSTITSRSVYRHSTHYGSVRVCTMTKNLQPFAFQLPRSTRSPEGYTVAVWSNTPMPMAHLSDLHVGLRIDMSRIGVYARVQAKISWNAHSVCSECTSYTYSYYRDRLM